MTSCYVGECDSRHYMREQTRNLMNAAHKVRAHQHPVVNAIQDVKDAPIFQV